MTLWFHLVCMALSWNISHLPLDYCLFWETPNIRKSSARIESQQDWWGSQHPLRTPKLYSTTKKDSFWDLGRTMSHVLKFVECLPWERWAFNSLIITTNYCVQGIEQFQKLYIGLEYVAPKYMGKPSKINKVAREFCKFSQRVKTVSIMSENCKYPWAEGETL